MYLYISYYTRTIRYNIPNQVDKKNGSGKHIVRAQWKGDRIVYDFKDKTYLITGGTSGMGLAAAKQISNGGGRVTITGLDPQRLHTARQELGSDSVVLENDSGSPTTGTDLARHVEKFGRLDGLWLNAAIARIGPVEEITVSTYNQIMDINVRGPILQLAALSALLKDNSSVVVTASSSVYEGAAATSLYAASKGALVAIARSWASALAPRGIRVNTLVPGPISTNLRSFLPDEARSEFENFVVNQVPLQRVGTSEEAAAVAMFLLSNASSYVTGSQYAVDGGLIMR
jgi:NAD(P)-dependent dehydrogenase (short-subunit alcohol dehydrogenase family)